MKNLKNIILMNEKFTSNNTKDNYSTLDTEESDYKNLILRLKEIGETITLLEKKYSKEF